MRIDKKENIALPTKKIHAIPVNSSIIVTSLNFDILREVKTIRQNPNKLEDVLRICDDLSFAIHFKFLSYLFLINSQSQSLHPSVITTPPMSLEL